MELPYDSGTMPLPDITGEVPSIGYLFLNR